MAEERTCPECGVPLSDGTDGEMCPRCLLRLGLETKTEKIDADTSIDAGLSISSHDLKKGHQLGDYRIIRLLGQGGMGVVYEAEQQNPKRRVALKVVRGGSFVDETTLRMFQREIHTLAHLQHPGIASIYESGRTDDGQHFFAMELVAGPTLAEWLTKREHDQGGSSTEIKLRLALFRKICEAVVYAHNRGVTHRDLKPANILVVDDSADALNSGTSTVPDIKILDFGLARITDSDLSATSIVTDVGTIAGTLPYMSPEQTRGNPDEVDIRTDVYSLGVILYEMLTGQLPYELGRAALHEIARVICEEPPRSLSDSWAGGRKPDTDIETIVRKTLEKGPSRRYQSVLALVEDVDRYLSGQPILARPPSRLSDFRDPG
jgi:serine/threonine protein kinase